MQSHAFRATNENCKLARQEFIAHSISRPETRKSHLSFHCQKINRNFHSDHELKLRIRSHESRVQRGVFQVRAVDEESMGDSSFSDWGDSNRPVDYVLSSSEDEDSDDGDIMLQPITDVDLPISKNRSFLSGDSFAVTAHRFGMLGRGQKKRKIKYGMLNNVGLMSFSTILILLVDHCAWRIVRLPLAPFHLTQPFLISIISVICVGYICVPLFRILKIQSIYRKKATIQYTSKKGTPTMGGLYLVPIGLLVAQIVLGFSSVEVSGAVAATIAFAAIGLLDDLLRLNDINNSFPGWMRTMLEVAVGLWFSYWMCTTDISTPYNMKMVIPLPAPMGLVRLEKLYPVLTSLCFVTMASGVDFTDGLDGLAAGTAALVFIGMSIVVLPICSDLAIFGASMAGACVGFLFQNRYKASIFMGDVGALALGGALAAMASCTGMFFPLFLSSGIYVVDALSVIVQVAFKPTKLFQQTGYKLQTASFHNHLRLLGIKEPTIVAAAYAVTCLLILCASYIGLTSA